MYIIEREITMEKLNKQFKELLASQRHMEQVHLEHSDILVRLENAKRNYHFQLEKYNKLLESVEHYKLSELEKRNDELWMYEKEDSAYMEITFHNIVNHYAEQGFEFSSRIEHWSSECMITISTTDKSLEQEIEDGCANVYRHAKGLLGYFKGGF